MSLPVAILNIGPFELLVLGGAAVLLFGGDLPQTARKVARFVARMRSTVHDLSSEFKAADRRLEQDNPLHEARRKMKSVAEDIFEAIPDVDRTIEPAPVAGSLPEGDASGDAGPMVPGMDPDGGTDTPPAPTSVPAEPGPATDAKRVDVADGGDEPLDTGNVAATSDAEPEGGASPEPVKREDDAG